MCYLVDAQGLRYDESGIIQTKMRNTIIPFHRRAARDSLSQILNLDFSALQCLAMSKAEADL
jgi:hypothetical protein